MQGLQAGQAASNQLAPKAPIRPLETLGQCADRAIVSAQRVQSFIDRFHGEEPATAGQGGEIMTVSYGSDLARLYGNLDALETALNVLEAIG